MSTITLADFFICGLFGWTVSNVGLKLNDKNFWIILFCFIVHATLLKAGA